MFRLARKSASRRSDSNLQHRIGNRGLVFGSKNAIINQLGASRMLILPKPQSSTGTGDLPWKCLK
jgi:hypothetical protein